MYFYGLDFWDAVWTALDLSLLFGLIVFWVLSFVFKSVWPLLLGVILAVLSTLFTIFCLWTFDDFVKPWATLFALFTEYRWLADCFTILSRGAFLGLFLGFAVTTPIAIIRSAAWANQVADKRAKEENQELNIKIGDLTSYKNSLETKLKESRDLCEQLRNLKDDIVGKHDEAVWSSQVAKNNFQAAQKEKESLKCQLTRTKSELQAYKELVKAAKLNQEEIKGWIKERKAEVKKGLAVKMHRHGKRPQRLFATIPDPIGTSQPPKELEKQS